MQDSYKVEALTDIAVTELEFTLPAAEKTLEKAENEALSDAYQRLEMGSEGFLSKKQKIE